MSEKLQRLELNRKQIRKLIGMVAMSKDYEQAVKDFANEIPFTQFVEGTIKSRDELLIELRSKLGEIELEKQVEIFEVREGRHGLKKLNQKVRAKLRALGEDPNEE